MDINIYSNKQPNTTWLEHSENNTELYDFSIQFGSLSEGDEVIFCSMKYENLQKLKHLINEAIK